MIQTSIDLKGAYVLVTDDVPANIDVLRQALETDDYQVMGAASGAEALEVAAYQQPDLILLDVMMPGLDGFETCQRFKEDETLRQIPIIFITARGDTEDIVRGLAAGGVDYIVKPFQQEEVLMRVRTHLERYRLMQAQAQHAAQLQQSYDELAQAHRDLEREIRQRQALASKLEKVSERETERWGVEGFVSQSPLLQGILQNIKMLEKADSLSVLITGESGTGKELIARAVHVNSARASGPFIPVNCATIPRELSESMLFGHKKGSFTGAHDDQEGFFDLADGGTLFLDEVGDMPADLQTKLLRVLEDGQVMPLGASQSHPVDVRVVAATHVDLDARIQQGGFRQDLFYRIARYAVQVPPLRQRKEDILLLAQHFLKLFAQEMGMEAPALGGEVAPLLVDYDYPGNIRELKNIVERALIESQGQDIGPGHLHLVPASPMSAAPPTLEETIEAMPLNFGEAEMALIERAMRQTGGNIAAAARLLGVERTKVYRRLKEAGRLEAYR